MMAGNAQCEQRNEDFSYEGKDICPTGYFGTGLVGQNCPDWTVLLAGGGS